MLPITPHVSYQTDEKTVFRNVSIIAYTNHVELQTAVALPHMLAFLKIKTTPGTWNFTINKAGVLIFSSTMQRLHDAVPLLMAEAAFSDQSS